jgi:hypothetical protein
MTDLRRGACRDATDERVHLAFWPVTGKLTWAEQENRTLAAESFCAHCPAINACLAVADAKPQWAQGVFAGSLRHEVADPDDELHGQYVADRLIPGAPASIYDREAVKARLAEKAKVPA